MHLAYGTGTETRCPTMEYKFRHHFLKADGAAFTANRYDDGYARNANVVPCIPLRLRTGVSGAFYYTSVSVAASFSYYKGLTRCWTGLQIDALTRG